MVASVQVLEVSKKYELGQTHSRLLSERLGRGLRRWFDGIARRDGNSTVQPLLDSAGRDEMWALKQVSLEVDEGEVVGIIGRNGAGKSTLLKILSRITPPTAGEVVLRGRVASLLEVGTGFHPELTGRENVFLNGAILGMSKAEIRGRFDAIVSFAEVERFIDTPVKRYSSGMHVRLAFAVAAHLDPEILIVDEVLAVGDAQFQGKCLGKLGEASKSGRTVIFVSHNMAAVASLCSRTYYLRNGRVAASGTPTEVVQEYLVDAGSGAANAVGHRRRAGVGTARIIHASVLGGTSEPRNVLLSGEPCRVVLECESSEIVTNISFRLGLYDFAGGHLAQLDSALFDQSFDLAPGRYRVECVVPNLPLAPGRYSLNAAITSGPALIDGVEQCADFAVEHGDFFGKGRLPDRGPFLVHQRWTCSEAAPRRETSAR